MSELGGAAAKGQDVIASRKSSFPVSARRICASSGVMIFSVSSYDIGSIRISPMLSYARPAVLKLL
jgi:hypothetical protein